VDRLLDPDVTPQEVAAAADSGRGAITDLFRLLETAPDASVRRAAGDGLARLWARDELVVEEEKAVVTRGYAVSWHARRRYPRAMRRPIPIGARFGVPFLGGDAPLGAGTLEWSYRVLGAGRVSLETFSEWSAPAGRFDFTIEPSDFTTNGPHRLVFQGRVRTRDLTSRWELDLPHVPFNFEFDPRLTVESLFCAPDQTLAEEMARSVSLAPGREAPHGPGFLALNEALALREPPALRIEAGLPRDLAHDVRIVFEGFADSFPAGSLARSTRCETPDLAWRFPIGPIAATAPIPIARPGSYRLRVEMVPNPELGWADPDIRALWPGTITTDWVEVQVVRL
jgi:hypothetical protein